MKNNIYNSDLEKALKNINKYGESDFFFEEFELKIINKYWDELKDKIIEEKTHDVKNYAVLKNDYGYRIVQKMEIMNLIKYGAIVFYIAEKIEDNRIRIDKNVACSYRINKTEEGNLYNLSGSYSKYQEKIKELSKSYEYIMKTDISDFYNQIYIHRVENIIDRCIKNNSISKEIEKFLLELNTSASKGIPVGTLFSAIIGESIMIDIDEYIMDQGILHTRYVDDIILVSNDKSQLQKIISNLTQYLYNNHRLSINFNKTRIYNAQEYVEKYLETPEIIEKNKIFDKLKEISELIYNEEIREYEEFYRKIGPYDYLDIELPDKKILDINELEDDEKNKLRIETLIEIFREEISKEKPDMGILKYVVRRSKIMRIRGILWDILGNFDKCIPILKEIVLYFLSITKRSEPKEFLNKFEEIIEKSEYRDVQYFKYCMGHYFANTKIFADNMKIISFIKNSNEINNYVTFAINNNKISWIREYKTKFNNLGFEERRAILYASKILPIDERKKWINRIDTNDLLEEYIKKYVLET